MGRRALLTAFLIIVALDRAEAFVSSPLGRRVRLAPGRRSPAAMSGASLRMASNPLEPQRIPKRASPSRHIRLRPRALRGDRRKFDVETAVTTYAKILPDGSEVTVDLHAQIHVGEGSYFGYYSDPELFTGRYDRVHYELVVGEDLLASNENGGGRVLRPAADGGNPLAASPSDVGMARGYGLACQVDSINYARDGWVHADYTREEFVKLAAEKRGDDANTARDTDSRPIWALASSASASSLPLPGALAEFVSALHRPLSPSVPLSSPVARRLFTNLFLPGDGLAAFIRSALWMGIPSPEAFVMLLDWSSLSPRPTGGISPAALPVLECLLSGNVREARKLVFGQMVVSGQSLAENSSSNGGDDASDLLLNKRNDKAVEVLRRSIEEDGCKRNALLFGGTHCRGLDSRLRSMGFVPKKTEWRTAWSVEVPKFGLGFASGLVPATGGSSRAVSSAFAGTATPDGLAVALLAVPLYLAIGGWDWVGTLRDVGGSLEEGQILDAGLEVVLYLIRHVALYLGLSKFVVEWDGASLFGASGSDSER